MFSIVAFAARTTDFSGQIFEADGITGVTLESGDVIKLRIGVRDSVTPAALEVVSGTPTENGSKITVDSLGPPAAYTIRLAEGDMAALGAGIYDCDLSLNDISETAPADAFKLVELGVVTVINTMHP